MKKGWQIKKLGEVCDIINGRNQKAVECANGQYPIYGSGGNVMGYASEYLCEEGTTIIGRKGSINNPIYIDTKFWNVDTAFGISSKPMMSSKYVYYFCKSFDFSKLNKGTTLPSLVKKDLLLIEVPVPSISEQQRIVALLDAEFAKIDALKANAERNLQNAKDLFCSIQTKVLENKSWKRYSLDEICNLITDGTHRTPKYQQQGIPFLSVKNITGGFLDLDDTKYISEEEHRELVKRCKPEKGDVLYSKVGTTGVAQLIDTEEEFSIFVSLALLKVKQEIVKNTLLVKILNSPYVREQAKKRTRGTANKNFVISDIKAVDVLIPPYNEQDVIEQTIDTYWSKVSSLQANYEKTIILCDDLKQALLRKAFNGEI